MRQSLRTTLMITALGLAAQTGWAMSAAPDSVLCWSQLELLQRGNKLTEAEADRFKKQCSCLEEKAEDNVAETCAEDASD